MEDVKWFEQSGLTVRACGENFLKVWDPRKSAWICFYPSSGSFHYDRGHLLGKGREALVSYLGAVKPSLPKDFGVVTGEYLNKAWDMAESEESPLSQIVRTLVTHIRQQRGESV